MKPIDKGIPLTVLPRDSPTFTNPNKLPVLNETNSKPMDAEKIIIINLKQMGFGSVWMSEMNKNIPKKMSGVNTLTCGKNCIKAKINVIVKMNIHAITIFCFS